MDFLKIVKKKERTNKSTNDIKTLINITINDMMYEKILSIPNFKNKNNKDKYFEDLIENNLNYEKDNMFYYDKEKFMKENVEIKIIEKKIKKKLFLLLTGVTGYDTYDSAVVCSYTKNEALNIASLNSDYFLNSDIKYIGKADQKLEIGVVIKSFNAG